MNNSLAGSSSSTAEGDRERERCMSQYVCIYMYIHICIYIHICAVRLGSEPIVAILKVRFWTKFSDRFWTNVISGYFYSGFRQFCVLKLVLCVLVLAD